MATNRTKRTRSRKAKLTGRQIEHLLFGWCLGNIMPFDSEEHRRQAWFENKDYLMNLPRDRRVPGFFGIFKKNEKPQAMLDYEKKRK